MQRKRTRSEAITDDQLCALIEAHQSHSNITSYDIADRREALSYYLGEPFGDEVAGRSQIVSREVADTIEWIKPSLMRIFASGEEVVKFDPRGPEDVEQAEQESEILNWSVLQKNNAFASLYAWFSDALLSRNAYMVAYWDESTDTAVEDYERLSIEEMNLLAQDDEIELEGEPEVTVEMEWSERPDPNDPTGQMMMPAQIEVPYYDVSVRRTKKKGNLRYKCIAPEQVVIDGMLQDVSLAESNFAGYWEMLTVSDVRARFPDADIPDDISDESGERDILGVSRSARDRLVNWNTPEEYGHIDPSLRLIKVLCCWVRVDRDGDGLAELRYVVKIGQEILYDEATDIVQMACLTPILFPHRHAGISIFDLVKDLQEIKSMMLRGMIDSTFLANNGRLAVNADRVNLDDLLISRPGGAVRTVGDPSGSIMPLVHPYIGNQIVQTLDYLDQIAEKRTGVTKYSQGLDANILTHTATGANLMANQASQRIELIARLFAETGVKDLFMICHALIRKHGSKNTIVKLRNNWVPVNPRSWVRRMDATMAVGLGTGDKQQQAQSLQIIGQLQQAMISGGVGIVTQQNLYHLAEKVVQSGGWKNAASFFTEPKKGGAQNGATGDPNAQQAMDPNAPFQPPQQLDPGAQDRQMQMQLEQAKLEFAKQQAQQAQMFEQYKLDKEMELKRAQAELDANKEVRKVEMQGHYKMLTDQLTAHASDAEGLAVQTATENARVPVVEAAQQALGPVMEQVGSLAQAAHQRNKPKAFRIVRQQDGSKIIHEVQ